MRNAAALALFLFLLPAASLAATQTMRAEMNAKRHAIAAGRHFAVEAGMRVLRAATGGQKQVEVAGATVREVIDGLVAAHPGLAGQLLAEDGDLNRFVNVFLNDTDVRHLQALDTPVEPRDTVLLLPAMAGGAR